MRIAGSAAALRVADATKWIALRSYPVFELAATTPIPSWAEPLGARGALRAALHAYRRVPAFRDLCDRVGWHDDRSLSGTERLMRFPITDKATYIEPYSIRERCLDGRLPLIGTEMDESSGSSGTPFNWVRGATELREVHRQLGQFAHYILPDPIVTINAFSMGAWSTGINTAQALRHNGMVKSPGPDPERIVHTLRALGPGYGYVITGYPPFLRELLTYGDAHGLDWRRYRMFGIVGGEGMSEHLRQRLLTRFVWVYSAYGASDLDIGVAAETPLSVWVRQRAAESHVLRQRLFGSDSRLPMLFQYNPLDYMIESVEGELVITVSRLCMLSPRIRYNIHDSGGGHSFDEVVSACRDVGLDALSVPTPYNRPHFRLPFLYVHGRSDTTISYMGANIYPEDIEQALFVDSGLGDLLGAFCLELHDTGDGTVRPSVHVEVLAGGRDDDSVVRTLRQAVVARLQRNSRDFRDALRENATAGDVLIRLHEPNQGPFAVNSTRIKRRYIVP